MLDDTIRVLTLEGVIDQQRLRETGNAAGVRRVDTLAPRGLYHRQPPRALDTDHLDPDLWPALCGSFGALDQPYGFIRCTVLKDALIVGQGSVVTRDSCLIRDSVAEFLGNSLTPEGFAPVGDGGWRLSPAPQRHITMPSLLLKRPWWRNYGHWLIDSAAMLALVTRLQLPSPWQIVVGRQETPAMRRLVADTVARLASGVTVAEHPDNEVWSCDELLYVSPLHVPPLFKHPTGLASLRALLLHDAPIVAQLSAVTSNIQPSVRRLFVSRGTHGVRRLDNEAELIALAIAHGYEVVEPQCLDLVGQARLFHSAACVVGVKGAALTNLLFCAAGAQCLVLSPGDFPDPFFWDLASHGTVSYSEIFGRLISRDRPRGHNSFVIDPARFAALLPT